MNNSPPKILIMIAWFGRWPGWMRLFLESCRWNPSINWLIVTDCGDPGGLPLNVKLFNSSFEDYRGLIARKLGIALAWNDAYKLCDLKPCFGVIHDEAIAGYDYWGWGDLDVIYGDIRALYTPDVLRHDLISSHAHIVAGHLALARNTPRMVNAFRQIRSWQQKLSAAAHCSFDEQIFSRMFLPVNWRRPWQRLGAPYLGGARLEEQFSTDIDPLRWIDGTRDFPAEWFWREGKLTCNKAGGREFLYLHFSHWQSSRWTNEAEAPWKRLPQLDQLPAGPVTAFRISRGGFTPLERTSAKTAA